MISVFNTGDVNMMIHRRHNMGIHIYIERNDVCLLNYHLFPYKKILY